jgi:hypothetical protein
MIETLKEPVQIDADVDSRVMAAIEAQPDLADAQPDLAGASTARPLSAWLRRRTIRLSPLGAFALAAGLAAVVLVGSIAGLRRGTETSQPPATPVSGEPTATPVSGEPTGAPLTQFVLVAPAATSVAVVGDFNDWNVSAPTPLMREAGDGVWWVTLPLPPGRYRYAYIVDGGTWRSDPDAPAADDEFGRPSSVVSIGGA